ncbi:L,D-transpeptidase family protein [Microbacterium sp. SLBN-146]|uniref:L,D-transpeptidase family protein n=1 Tax=Microbacterium sp. SLBN-146 TaxID=2768457 RepID=UPI00114EB717|nr:L,D-transpeptidase family protein [Microbacterium sp. SLBN-146]TQJ32402.1 L,D-transpeptidase-like protein [Microbacterium sp. SLBN-146]
MGESSEARSRTPIVVSLSVGFGVLIATAVVTFWILTSATLDAAPAPSPTASSSPPVATPTPASTPTPTGPPPDATAYDTSALPRVDVFAVVAALPVDDDPTGSFTGQAARARGEVIPVFASPSTPPVAALARDQEFDGTVVPVIERHAHWLRVLLPGRQATPSAGDPGQLTGWVRATDVDVTTQDARVDVSISARTIEIVRGDARELVASDFAWGVDSTPTPTGRSFIMTTAVVPEFAYTRGNPITYLSVQSPTLDGFGGADAAVTAFHYHDSRSGSISNGCLRVDAAAAAALAALPHGTPVSISP